MVYRWTLFGLNSIQKELSWADQKRNIYSKAIELIYLFIYLIIVKYKDIHPRRAIQRIDDSCEMVKRFRGKKRASCQSHPIVL